MTPGPTPSSTVRALRVAGRVVCAHRPITGRRSAATPVRALATTTARNRRLGCQPSSRGRRFSEIAAMITAYSTNMASQPTIVRIHVRSDCKSTTTAATLRPTMAASAPRRRGCQFASRQRERSSDERWQQDGTGARAQQRGGKPGTNSNRRLLPPPPPVPPDNECHTLRGADNGEQTDDEECPRPGELRFARDDPHPPPGRDSPERASDHEPGDEEHRRPYTRPRPQRRRNCWARTRTVPRQLVSRLHDRTDEPTGGRG